MKPSLIRRLSVLWFAACAAAGASEPAKVLSLMERVADWQLANPSAHKPTDWTQGAGYAGIMALAGLSESPRYRDAMVAMGENNGWQLGPKKYYADDHCVGQAYAELYEQLRDPRMIAPMKERFDFILANPHDGLLVFRTPRNQDRWSWCDALFMAPPAWARLHRMTGNESYLDFMIREWWVTSDYLYDKDEHLYYRDSTYFDKREANGAKVFWGRGNGWVMGGLVRVLQYLPTNHPSRERFEKQFKDMSAKLLACQQADGMWRASLLDPASYPLKETSSTGFFTYALAWGVNQGLLDRATCEPAVRKAWASLVECVAADGKLTHVQPIGADPQKFPDDSTEVYGVGAFLLAGSEIYRMKVLEKAAPVVVSVGNPSAMHRLDETVEIAWSETGMAPAVMDALTTRIIDSQRIDGRLLFQANLVPGETRRFLVIPTGHLAGIPAPVARTFCRFVPERMDDFAWESDRIAHRMYGPALITGEGTVSSGIDVWVKRTPKLVIDRWYQSGDYHKDHGEGMDYYSVAHGGVPTRGCGGSGIWDGKALHVSSNFTSHKILANGPLRSVFELSYDEWDASGRKVSEVKRISIDAGSRFSRVESVFKAEGAEPLQVGVGIAQRNGGEFRSYLPNQLMAYWEPEVKGNGQTGCTVILPKGLKSFVRDQANFLAIAEVKPDEPLVYHIGAGWSGGGDFANHEEWLGAVHRERQRLERPLVVGVE
jgi:unsaturated rhamnogalacturonyl hydrolase